MTVERIELYNRPNGDRWFFAIPAPGTLYQTRAELPIRWPAEPIEIGAFLSRGSINPEHKAPLDQQIGGAPNVECGDHTRRGIVKGP